MLAQVIGLLFAMEQGGLGTKLKYNVHVQVLCKYMLYMYFISKKVLKYKYMFMYSTCTVLPFQEILKYKYKYF